MKKLIFISIILFAGLVNCFAFSNMWYYRSCNYQSSFDDVITTNLPPAYVFAQVQVDMLGVAGILAYGGNGTYQLQSNSYEGLKTTTWFDYYWRSFEFYATNPYGGPKYAPGACYVLLMY